MSDNMLFLRKVLCFIPFLNTVSEKVPVTLVIIQKQLLNGSLLKHLLHCIHFFNQQIFIEYILYSPPYSNHQAIAVNTQSP